MAGVALGRDLLVTPHFMAHSGATLDLAQAGGDLALASGVDALRQALVLRLLTPLGSLAALGHPHYGSRLHELIGAEFNEAARLRARGFVLAALRQEPRVARVLALSLNPTAGHDPHSLRLHLQVQAQGLTDPVALALEVVG